MRKNEENQLPLAPLWPDHRLSDELRMISRILDENPETTDLIVQDLCDKTSPEKGARGMTGEQVLRCAVLKSWHGLSYRKLAFHLADSQSFGRFARLPTGWTPSRACLQENISRIDAQTWERIWKALVKWAEERKLERGQKIRADSTTVESDVRHPLDSQLLYDAVRVVTRLLRELGRSRPVAYSDHTRRAKRRVTNIRNSRGKNRTKHYRDLLKVAGWTYGYGVRVLEHSSGFKGTKDSLLLGRLRRFLQLLRQVIEQTEARVIRGEKVPAADKVVSIFEPHTDIIQKGGRETVFGHKVFLTCGESSLILDCRVTEGNPADSAQLRPIIERQQQIYGRPPRQAGFDGSFASQDNLKWAKQRGVRDVAFAKKGRLKVSDMVRSSWVYRQLRRFRSGIEGCISFWKRVFGARRCTWKGWQHFNQYVHLSVVSFNLLVLARLCL